MFVFSVSAWFPGGATLSQPYISWPWPLSEPCLRYLRTRLPTWSICRKPEHPSFSAMWCSFVSTGSPLLRTADASSLHATMCSFLSSSSITRLHRYYEAIRLPVPHLSSSLFSCPAYSLCSERDTGPPGLPCNHNVRHAMVSDPEEAGITLPLTAVPVLTSTS